MAFTFKGFPGSVADVDWSWMTRFLGYEGTTCSVVPGASEDRRVWVQPGRSNVCGILVNVSEQESVILEPNPSSFSRVDRIIMQADWPSKQLQVTYNKGIPSPNPQPPGLVKSPGVKWELSLARVTVGPGQGTLTEGDVTNEGLPLAGGFYSIDTLAKAPGPSSHPSLIWHTPSLSLRAPVGTEYKEIAHGRGVESVCGTAEDVAFNGSGVAVINHGLGWTPTAMSFTPHLVDGNGGSVYVTTRSSATPYTSTTVQVVGKETSTGARYQSSLTRIDWIAHRNV